MSPKRLNPEQRPLYDALVEGWGRYARWVILIGCVATTILVGLLMGIRYGMQQSLQQSARVATALQKQVELNKLMITHEVEMRHLQEQEYNLLSHTIELLRKRAVVNERQEILRRH